MRGLGGWVGGLCGEAQVSARGRACMHAGDSFRVCKSAAQAVECSTAQ